MLNSTDVAPVYIMLNVFVLILLILMGWKFNYKNIFMLFKILPKILFVISFEHFIDFLKTLFEKRRRVGGR